MPHIDPVKRSEIEDSNILAQFEHYKNTRGFTPNSIMTMARRPHIAKAFMALNQAVLYEGAVPEETKILVSLACSYAAGCNYCQSHMANLASIYKASDQKIAALWDFENSDLFNAAERAAIALALKAGRLPNEVTGEDFDELKKHYDAGQIVEIVASVALFGYLNRLEQRETPVVPLRPCHSAPDPTLNTHRYAPAIFPCYCHSLHVDCPLALIFRAALSTNSH